jgi:PPP family 3-phenylpropionic acid transporter
MSPIGRLAAFWFVYMGSVGIFFPFFGLYLRENAGLSGLEVGTVLSVIPLVGLAAQPLWGQLADRSGARSRVLALVAGGAGLAQLLLPRAEGFPALVAATALLAIFITSVIPMAMSVSLAILRDAGRHAFGIARAAGTVGYLVLVVSFPPLLRHFTGGADNAAAPPGLPWMFPAISVLALVGAAIASTLPRQGVVSMRAPRGGLRLLLRHPPMLRLLAYSFAVYFFLNGPIQLFPLFIRNLGGGLEDLSRMWVWMLLLEIPLVALSGTLLARLGSRTLLAIGVLAGGIRWSASALTDSLALTAVLGLLHGIVVLGLGIGASLYVEEAIPEPLRSTGQALLATIGVGLGGILSNLACGWLFDHASPRATYLACGLGAAALGALAPWALPRPRRPEAASA